MFVQNELILNLWMKWIKPVFDTTFFKGLGGGRGLKQCCNVDITLGGKAT